MAKRWTDCSKRPLTRESAGTSIASSVMASLLCSKLGPRKTTFLPTAATTTCRCDLVKPLQIAWSGHSTCGSRSCNQEQVLQFDWWRGHWHHSAHFPVHFPAPRSETKIQLMIFQSKTHFHREVLANRAPVLHACQLCPVAIWWENVSLQFHVQSLQPQLPHIKLHLLL